MSSRALVLSCDGEPARRRRTLGTRSTPPSVYKKKHIHRSRYRYTFCRVTRYHTGLLLYCSVGRLLWRTGTLLKCARRSRRSRRDKAGSSPPKQARLVVGTNMCRCGKGKYLPTYLHGINYRLSECAHGLHSMHSRNASCMERMHCQLCMPFSDVFTHMVGDTHTW